MANDAVDRHDDDPPGDADAREAFLGLAAFFVVTVTGPPPLAAPSWPELLSAAQAAAAAGSAPVAGCSKSAAGQCQYPKNVWRKAQQGTEAFRFFSSQM